MTGPALTLQPSPDYYVRALALWPRLEPPRLQHVRHDPNRMAALISRRTSLSVEAIIELLGDFGHAAEARPAEPDVGVISCPQARRRAGRTGPVQDTAHH